MPRWLAYVALAVDPAGWLARAGVKPDSFNNRNVTEAVSVPRPVDDDRPRRRYGAGRNAFGRVFIEPILGTAEVLLRRSASTQRIRNLGSTLVRILSAIEGAVPKFIQTSCTLRI